MKIRLTDIPAAGLPIAEVIPPQALNERLSSGSSHGFEFLQGLDVSLTVYKSANGAETKGRVISRYRQPCARCAEGVERDIELPTNFILQQRPEELEGVDSEEYEDGIGITFYDGEHIDLEDLIEETIILSLSIYWHPEEDAEGKCQLCHKLVRGPTASATKEKSAAGTSLGDLIKKAGI